MTKDQIRAILGKCLSTTTTQFSPPTGEEWDTLETKHACKLPLEMRYFIELMAEYDFPGDILNVGSGPNNGNDSIDTCYEYESKFNPRWSPEMIPFYSIGNGDYFCVSTARGSQSPVFYYFAERGEFPEYSDSFESWIAGVPQFLA